MSLLKAKILRHLSEHGPATVYDTAEAIAKEIGTDQVLIEYAMREMIDSAQLKSMAGPDADPEGKVEGKYAPFNEKRFKDERAWEEGGATPGHPWGRPINYETAN